MTERVLCDTLLELLSTQLTKDDIYRLASKLDISQEDVEASFANFCTNEKLAIHDILDTWLTRQDSRAEAYQKLVKAMIHPDIGLNLIAREVLGYEDHEEDSQITNCKLFAIGTVGSMTCRDHSCLGSSAVDHPG